MSVLVLEIDLGKSKLWKMYQNYCMAIEISGGKVPNLNCSLSIRRIDAGKIFLKFFEFSKERHVWYYIVKLGNFSRHFSKR